MKKTINQSTRINQPPGELPSLQIFFLFWKHSELVELVEIHFSFYNRSGKIENGRPEYWIGAHVKGKNNVSLGVCLIGRHKFTKKQFISLERVLKRWKSLYPEAIIVGHRDAANTQKTCPNFDVKTWVEDTFT